MIPLKATVIVKRKKDKNSWYGKVVGKEHRYRKYGRRMLKELCYWIEREVIIGDLKSPELCNAQAVWECKE